MGLRHCAILFLLIHAPLNIWAQDETIFRELYLYADKEKIKKRVEKDYKLKARSNRHLIDMTGDDRPESFYTAKKDGEDWFHLFDNKGKEVFRYQLDANGPWARLFRIQKRVLNDKTDVYLLYFYEGITKYLNFKGTSRLYLLTIDNKDLKSASVYKGPILWDETRDFRDHYHQRKYEVSLFDLDRDKIREVTVNYGRMSRVYKYLGKGKWLNMDDQEAL